MLRAWVLGCSVLYVCLFAGAAFAEDFDRLGPYGAFHVFGVATPAADKEIENDIPGKPNVDVDMTGAAGLLGGYRFHPNMSFELEFDVMPHQKVDIEGQGSDRIRTYTGTFNGKVYLLTGRFQPYFVGGIGTTHFDGPSDSVTDLVGRLGAGVDCYVSESVYLDAGIDGLIGTGDVEDYNQLLFGVGVGVRF